MNAVVRYIFCQGRQHLRQRRVFSNTTSLTKPETAQLLFICVHLVLFRGLCPIFFIFPFDKTGKKVNSWLCFGRYTCYCSSRSSSSGGGGGIHLLRYLGTSAGRSIGFVPKRQDGHLCQSLPNYYCDSNYIDNPDWLFQSPLPSPSCPVQSPN